MVYIFVGRWKLHTILPSSLFTGQPVKILFCTIMLCLQSMYSVLAREVYLFFSGKEMHPCEKKKKL